MQDEGQRTLASIQENPGRSGSLCPHATHPNDTCRTFSKGTAHLPHAPFFCLSFPPWEDNSICVKITYFKKSLLPVTFCSVFILETAGQSKCKNAFPDTTAPLPRPRCTCKVPAPWYLSPHGGQSRRLSWQAPGNNTDEHDDCCFPNQPHFSLKACNFKTRHTGSQRPSQNHHDLGVQKAKLFS